MLYERDGAVATLTLNRPERLNAIVPELIDDLEAALDRAEADAEVRVIRLRGAGRAFCAGYDIEWGAEAMEEAERAVGPDRRPPHDVALRRAPTCGCGARPSPVIAQVHGFCVGGGTDFALCSDLIVCAEDSPHRLPAGTRLGLADDRDVDLPARPRAREAPAADRRPARRPPAVEWGLASECAPEAELDDAAVRARRPRRPAPRQPAAR